MRESILAETAALFIQANPEVMIADATLALKRERYSSAD